MPEETRSDSPSLPSVVALLTLIALAPATGSAARRTPAASDCGDASIPMRDWGGRPSVEVFLGDRGPFLFHIDTGTSVALLLGTRLQAELGPAPSSAAGELPELRLGGASFRGVPMRTFDFEALGAPDAPAGVLGLPLFASCLLTLDFPRREVRLSSGKLRADDPDVVTYRTDPVNEDLVVVPIELAGRVVEAHLDTGSPGEVTLLDRSAASLPLSGAPVQVGIARTPDGEAPIRTATLAGELRLARYRVANPRLAFADLVPMVDGGVGNLGSGLLGRFELTLDQRTRRLRLREPAGGDATAAPARALHASPARYGIGAMMRPEPTAMVVDGVVPGAAAEAAGLAAGDRIVAVNGTAVADLAPGALGAIFGAPNPVTLAIERAGARIELAVTPRVR